MFWIFQAQEVRSMSFQHMQAVVDSSRSRGAARAVLLVLAYRANPDGICWPSLSRIARDAGVSRKTVSRQISSLKTLGELEVLDRGGRLSTTGGPQWSSRYRITLLRVEGGVAMPPPSNGGEPLPEGGVGAGKRVESQCPLGGASVTPERKENSHLQPSTERPAKATGLPGRRIDYNQVKLPTIEDHADIFAIEDVVVAAMAVTRERDISGFGHWVKYRKAARKQYEDEKADRLFRECISETWSEIKAGEVDWPGAILNKKLFEVFGPL